MAQFPSLPLFTDAYLADTRHLSAQQHGAYLLLLMMAWRTPDCAIPDDDATLARWASLDLRSWRSNRDVILSFWRPFTGDDGKQKWRQLRLLDERKHAEHIHSKNVAAGKASALKRRERGSAIVRADDQQEFNPQTQTHIEEDKSSSPLPPTEPSTKVSTRAKSATTLQQHLAASGGIPPVEWGQWAHSTFGWDVDRISFEWDDFSDYWSSGNAKGGGRKSDWPATWRSHCRRFASDSRRGYRVGGKARSGFAAAFASSVANRYGISPDGGGVSGGSAAEGTGENSRTRSDRLPSGEIPF